MNKANRGKARTPKAFRTPNSAAATERLWLAVSRIAVNGIA
jgi:hypothetical protein